MRNYSIAACHAADPSDTVGNTMDLRPLNAAATPASDVDPMRPAGFTIDGPVAIPRRPFDDTTRQRVMRVTAAAVLGYTPEDITNFLAVGFPDRVEQEVSRPLAGDELAALAGVIVAAAETSTPELTTT